ncbi:hypothetical protein [Cryptosporangium sp. NPDC051539]|uniref:hypothetical protein n=1 Tax=Cryptosporangium sp. NPDC051539 TaxID=3363962 RepID=UPI00378DB483
MVTDPGPAQGPLHEYFAEGGAPESAAADLVRLVNGVLSPEPAELPPDAATVLSALATLREVQAELTRWEPRLVDAARRLGVSWHDLAPALGVASRQAAERRYLRSRAARDDEPGTTRDERVRNERDRRAEDRAVVEWARRHAATLRQIAARVADLHGLPELDEPARHSVGRVHETLGADDTSALIAPLRAARDSLGASHPALAKSIDDVIERTEALRGDTRRQRHGSRD